MKNALLFLGIFFILIGLVKLCLALVMKNREGKDNG